MIFIVFIDGQLEYCITPIQPIYSKKRKYI